MSQTPPRVYPLTRTEEDERFSSGLLGDIARIMEIHGYPPIERGPDRVRLVLFVYSFAYGMENA
ncbi:hypothetical protein [Streptomyces phytophilus]|uniref:hypothetical protein n=1 Tax=Streptomyces phytophilus TaxID=722715 RepID=UPI0015F0C7BE|nr:hypothetical protein [Streptomyces phytophilus]